MHLRRRSLGSLGPMLSILRWKHEDAEAVWLLIFDVTRYVRCLNRNRKQLCGANELASIRITSTFQALHRAGSHQAMLLDIAVRQEWYDHKLGNKVILMDLGRPVEFVPLSVLCDSPFHFSIDICQSL